MANPVSNAAVAYVRAVNENDPARFIACFADGAVVNDAGGEIHGIAAIQAWAASDIFAANVHFDVLSESGNEGNGTVTAVVDGTFDRTGLPNPLFMTFDVLAVDGKITKLTCRLAERQ